MLPAAATRIPQGGGHRLRDRATAPRGRRGGYDFLHLAVDDCSRVACVQTYPNERGPTTARFLTQAHAFFRQRGLTLQAVMTDRACAYTKAHAFRTPRVQLGIRHLVTRPYRPQTNGKAARFIKTLFHEWAYCRLFRSNAARLRTLPAWLTSYNHHRPHTALDGLVPMRVLVNKARGNHVEAGGCTQSSDRVRISTPAGDGVAWVMTRDDAIDPLRTPDVLSIAQRGGPADDGNQARGSSQSWQKPG